MPRPTDLPSRLRHGRVIVAGYGPVGRIVAEALEAAGVEITVVELNIRTIETQASLEKPVCFGDICDPETLKRAGIDTADAIIVAIPDEDAAIEACKVARLLHPDIFIAARANFVSRGHLARDAGADVVIVEEIVTGQAMAQAVMDKLLPSRLTEDDHV